MSKKEFNAFDEMGGIVDPVEAARIKAENEIMWNKLDYLIHQVFEQNPAGKELLSIWKETLIMVPTVTAHSTQFQVGIEEGKKTFVRNIYSIIKNVEGKK